MLINLHIANWDTARLESTIQIIFFPLLCFPCLPLFDKVVLRISAEQFVRCDKVQTFGGQVRTGKAHVSRT